MTLWKLRDPNLYPIKWTEVILEARKSKSPYPLDYFRDYDAARMLCEKFRCFRYCLRNFASYHRAFETERDYRITTKIIPDNGRFRVDVEVKPLSISPADVLARL